ncbi:ligand-gated ion channel protein (macronuclear) [Tetrahymena thermophila SB210]|uniref:Ligand-gated ion channel protein n=1 Tax=Tetrahymena thermophila (strain SB210) TaxID=312017 RepID=Q23EY0_TETTS|nr:ligand-gated ion channel protein [Tetrahymena thermophila SB210]EAR95125.2 ligand-gated ion channel protein [Tetrahymena thermophila SB210]|eukprot:XP_001015370.2 ligand-gated ion channel protein [Tetrahymena thermophila SB210]
MERKFYLQIIILGIILLSIKQVDALKYTILTSPFPPMVYCTEGDTDKANFQGLDIEMFNNIANQLGWASTDFTYECIDFSQLNSYLQKTDKYVGFIGGLTIDSKREQDGIIFSYPMWNTGISILIYNKNDYWLQVTVLTSQICALVIATALVIGFIHFFLERQEYCLDQFLWNSMTSIFFITTINLKRSGSRLIQITFWFMIMIISSTYLAKMTNILTIEQPLYSIKSPYDLNNKRVINYSVNSYQLYQYGAIPLYSDFGSDGETLYDDISLEQVVKNLSRDDDFKVVAYAIDDIQAQSFEFSNCNLYLVGRNFYQFNYGMAFNMNQDPNLISQINKQIQIYNVNSFSKKIIDAFLQKNYSKCNKGAFDDQITFDQVGGLYIIQAIAICVSILVYLIAKIPLVRRILIKLQKYKIVSEPIQESKALQGDELVLQNIKQVTKEQITKFQQSIEDRLDEMDENIIKFYEILLNEEQLKKLKIIEQDQNSHNDLLQKSDHINNLFIKKTDSKISYQNQVHYDQNNKEAKEDNQEQQSQVHKDIVLEGEVEAAESDNHEHLFDNNHF